VEKKGIEIFAMAPETNLTYPSTNPFASRALSAFELLFGAFIVIGHNVFHIVPNEVIVLSLLGLVSIKLRDGGWFAMGFSRPRSWSRILLIALAAAAVRILLGQFVIEPVTGFFWPAPTAPALANEITGNAKIALLALLLVWTLSRSAKKSCIEDISLRARPTSEGDRQWLTGLGLYSCRFCLATAIITKVRRESLIPE
jgi:hypothetical protein